MSFSQLAQPTAFRQPFLLHCRLPPIHPSESLHFREQDAQRVLIHNQEHKRATPKETAALPPPAISTLVFSKVDGKTFRFSSWKSARAGTNHTKSTIVKALRSQRVTTNGWSIVSVTKTAATNLPHIPPREKTITVPAGRSVVTDGSSANCRNTTPAAAGMLSQNGSSSSSSGSILRSSILRSSSVDNVTDKTAATADLIALDGWKTAGGAAVAVSAASFQQGASWTEDAVNATKGESSAEGAAAAAAPAAPASGLALAVPLPSANSTVLVFDTPWQDRHGHRFSGAGQQMKSPTVAHDGSSLGAAEAKDGAVNCTAAAAAAAREISAVREAVVDLNMHYDLQDEHELVDSFEDAGSSDDLFKPQEMPSCFLSPKPTRIETASALMTPPPSAAASASTGTHSLFEMKLMSSASPMIDDTTATADGDDADEEAAAPLLPKALLAALNAPAKKRAHAKLETQAHAKKAAKRHKKLERAGKPIATTRAASAAAAAATKLAAKKASARIIKQKLEATGGSAAREQKNSSHKKKAPAAKKKAAATAAAARGGGGGRSGARKKSGFKVTKAPMCPDCPYGNIRYRRS